MYILSHGLIFSNFILIVNYYVLLFYIQNMYISDMFTFHKNLSSNHMSKMESHLYTVKV